MIIKERTENNKVIVKHPSKETKEKMSLSQKKRFKLYPHPRGMLGKHHTEETKRRIGLAHKGNKWNLGKHLTEEHKRKIVLSLIGRSISEKTRKKISIRESETKKRLFKEGKIISTWKGKHHSEESNQKNREKHLGKTPWNKGKHGIISKETSSKIRNARMKQIFPLKDTSIEIKIQEGLKKLNIPFETHKPILNITQCDIFIKPNILIFADGCWWHGCEQCFDRNSFLKSELGKRILLKKSVNNMISIKLSNEGFKVLHFWEHDINKNFEDKVLDEIIFSVQKIRERRSN